jgi:hypothetical protein
MTPKVLGVGNEKTFSTIPCGFCWNVNLFWKKGPLLKLNSNGDEIVMRWGDGPEDVLLWQIERTCQHIVESLVDGIAAHFEKIHDRSLSPLLPVLHCGSNATGSSNPITQPSFAVFGDVIGSEIHWCLIIAWPVP